MPAMKGSERTKSLKSSPVGETVSPHVAVKKVELLAHRRVEQALATVRSSRSICGTWFTTTLRQHTSY